MADCGNCIPLLIQQNCSGKLIPAINRTVASLFPLWADCLAAISWLTCRCQLFPTGAPLKWMSYILALAAETGFWHLKSKFPLNVKIKYQRFNAKSRPLDLSHLAPVNFRWMVPLMLVCYWFYRNALLFGNFCSYAWANHVRKEVFYYL
jgi:hypothetical protein